MLVHPLQANITKQAELSFTDELFVSSGGKYKGQCEKPVPKGKPSTANPLRSLGFPPYSEDFPQLVPAVTRWINFRVSSVQCGKCNAHPDNAGW